MVFIFIYERNIPTKKLWTANINILVIITTDKYNYWCNLSKAYCISVLTTEDAELLIVWFFNLKVSAWFFIDLEVSDLLLLSEGLVIK